MAFLNARGGITDVLLVDPGEARAHLVEVRVSAINEDDSQNAPVAIEAESVELDLAPEYQLAQVLFGTLAESLGFLRRINPAQAYAQQLVAWRQDFARIAIGDTDYDAGDWHLLAESAVEQQEAKQCDKRQS